MKSRIHHSCEECYIKVMAIKSVLNRVNDLQSHGAWDREREFYLASANQLVDELTNEFNNEDDNGN